MWEDGRKRLCDRGTDAGAGDHRDGAHRARDLGVTELPSETELPTEPEPPAESETPVETEPPAEFEATAEPPLAANLETDQTDSLAADQNETARLNLRVIGDISHVLAAGVWDGSALIPLEVAEEMTVDAAYSGDMLRCTLELTLDEGWTVRSKSESSVYQSGESLSVNCWT